MTREVSMTRDFSRDWRFLPVLCVKTYHWHLRFLQSVPGSQSLCPHSLGARAAKPRKDVVCCVEQALGACSTQHTTSGERRRREQASEVKIRQALIDDTTTTKEHCQKEKKMSNEEHNYSVWIEAECWVPGMWTPDDDNTDVVVTRRDGSRWGATFISYQHVQTLTEKNKRTEENLSGAYFWVRDMILVDEVSRQRIEEVVHDLINEGDFELVFRQYPKEEAHEQG